MKKQRRTNRHLRLGKCSAAVLSVLLCLTLLLSSTAIGSIYATSDGAAEQEEASVSVNSTDDAEAEETQSTDSDGGVLTEEASSAADSAEDGSADDAAGTASEGDADSADDASESASSDTEAADDAEEESGETAEEETADSGTAGEEAEDGTASDDALTADGETADSDAADAEDTESADEEAEEADEEEAVDPNLEEITRTATVSSEDGTLKVEVTGSSALLADAEVRVTLLEGEDLAEAYQALLTEEAGDDALYILRNLFDISLVKKNADGEYEIIEPGETVTVSLSGSLLDEFSMTTGAVAHFEEGTAAAAASSNNTAKAAAAAEDTSAEDADAADAAADDAAETDADNAEDEDADAEDAADAAETTAAAAENTGIYTGEIYSSSALLKKSASAIAAEVENIALYQGSKLEDTSALNDSGAAVMDTVSETASGSYTVQDGALVFTTDTFSTVATLTTYETDEDGYTIVPVESDWSNITNLLTDFLNENYLTGGSYKFVCNTDVEGYIKVDAPIYINNTADVNIDLNGCQLWVDCTNDSNEWRYYGAFYVYTTLNITDSSGSYEETTTKKAVSDSDAALYGNEASLEESVDENTGYTVYTLTYYVTESSADSSQTGHTTETLYKYTKTMQYTSKGGIYSNNSGKDSTYTYSAYGNVNYLIYVDNGSLTLNGGTYSNYSGQYTIYATSSGESASSVTLGGAIISDCSSKNTGWTGNGKGVYISGTIVYKYGMAVGVSKAPLTMTDGAILNCTTGSGCQGGAIYGSLANINISGGVIAGNTSSSDGGGISLAGSTLTLSNDAVIAGNESTNGCGGGIRGGYYNSSGSYYSTITISDDVVISGNSAESAGSVSGSQGGGGIYVANNTTIDMSGGYITNNQVDAAQNNTSNDTTNSGENGSNGGGGIYVGYQSTLSLSGGYITGNYAKEAGGGIYAGGQGTAGASYGGKLKMTGGTVASNVAGMTASEVSSSEESSAKLYGAEGGGIYFNSSSNTISGGYITNNTTNTQVDWGGGGIFIAQNAALSIEGALIEGNTAGGYGGGVAACPTGTAAVTGASGALIYGNTANGENMSATTTSYNSESSTGANYDIDNLINSANLLSSASNGADYFSPLTSIICGTALGGGSQEWSGVKVSVTSSDSTYSVGSEAESVTVSASEILETSSAVLALAADPSAQTISAGESAATVYITGNYSYTHGGGIMTNGTLDLGGEYTAVASAGAEIEAEKAYEDGDGTALALAEGDFTFVLLSRINDDGTWSESDVVDSAVNDAEGAISLAVENFYIQDYLSGSTSTGTKTYTYYLVETTDSDKTVTAWDDTVYVITFTVQKGSETITLSDGSTTATCYTYSVTSVKVSERTKTSTSTTGLIENADYTANGTTADYTIVTSSTGSTTDVSLMSQKVDLTTAGASFTNVYAQTVESEEETETPSTTEEEETAEETEEAEEAEEVEETVDEDDTEEAADEEDADEEDADEDDDDDEDEDSETSSLTKTGDTAMPLLWGILLVLAACGIVAAVIAAGRKRVR